MPEILATRCGSIESSKQASMIDGRDRIVAAAGAQRGDLALVIPVGVAEVVLGQAGMMEFRLGDIGHDTTLRSGVSLSWSWWSPMAPAMKRAVIGVPS